MRETGIIIRRDAASISGTFPKNSLEDVSADDWFGPSYRSFHWIQGPGFRYIEETEANDTLKYKILLKETDPFFNVDVLLDFLFVNETVYDMMIAARIKEYFYRAIND